MSAIIPTNRPITYQLQYRKCGATHPCTPCLEGRGHGPYWYAYWKEGTRLRQRYIPERVGTSEMFPYSSIGLLNSRATLTKLPLEQHTPLLTLTKWASSLSHVVLHTIFLTPEYLLLLPVLEETTKTLLSLHFWGDASLQCVPRSLKHFAPVSFIQLQKRYGPIYAPQSRLLEVDQALLDQFTNAYEEAAFKRSTTKSG